MTKCICQTICSGTNWQYVGTVRHVVGGQNREMVTGRQWGLNDEMVGLIGNILLVSSVKNSLGKLFHFFQFPSTFSTHFHSLNYFCHVILAINCYLLFLYKN